MRLSWSGANGCRLSRLATSSGKRSPRAGFRPISSSLTHQFRKVERFLRYTFALAVLIRLMLESARARSAADRRLSFGNSLVEFLGTKRKISMSPRMSDLDNAVIGVSGPRIAKAIVRVVS